jgi:hypothetical protein
MKTAFVYATEETLQTEAGNIFKYFRDTTLPRCVEHVVVFDSPTTDTELGEFHGELIAYADAAAREFPPVYFMTDDFDFISRIVAELSTLNANVAFELTPTQRAALHSRA